MSSDCVATRRARISAQAGFRNADRDGAVGGHAESPRYAIRSSSHRGLGPRAASGRREHHLRTQEQRSVEGLARIADLDAEVPPFVALEQAAQLVPSELEVVDEHHRLAVVADRVDLPSERAGEQLEAAGAWISRHVAAGEARPGA